MAEVIPSAAFTAHPTALACRMDLLGGWPEPACLNALMAMLQHRSVQVCGSPPEHSGIPSAISPNAVAVQPDAPSATL